MVSDSDSPPAADEVPSPSDASADAQPHPAPPPEATQSTTDAGRSVRPERIDLPDWEELTPELMEDECLRGDAMLRGAVLLLALLLGWTFITETGVLVGIRTGEYIIGHGGLPPRTDVFSGSVEGRTWVNLGWLSDVLLGIVHRSLGLRWLSVLTALTAAATFWVLSRISLPGVSTWWTSVCYAVTLLAVFPALQPGSPSLTLLGLALLLWILFQWTVEPAAETTSRSMGALPFLFLFWSNLDPRAWFGILLLVLFTVGRRLLGGDEPAAANRRNWTLACVSIVVGLLAHPWPGRPALAGWTQYRVGVETATYGGVSEFLGAASFSLLDGPFWERLDVFAVAALGLMALSLILLVMTFQQWDWGWRVVWLTANLAGLLIGGLWPCAAVVNGVVAALAGQDWYRRRFPMEYAIDTWSVLWGRGGRAVTVLSFFLLAYVGINGALMGPGGRRIGMGLDPRWSNRLESLDKYVVKNAYTERIVPMMPDQGDLLLWLGKKPFIDSRFSLYIHGERNLLSLHRRLRGAIFASRLDEDADERAEFWKETLSEFQAYDILTRLWGANPAYEHLFSLMTHPDWRMTGFGASAACFTRADLTDEALQAHVEEHRQTRYVQQTFVDWDSPATVLLPAWPRAASAYDRWLIQEIPHSTNAAQVARHYNEIRNRLGQFMTAQQAAALATLSIRLSRRALSDNPNDPLPYRVLNDAYSHLNFLEQQMAAAAGGVMSLPLRGGQALASAFHSVQASGDDPDDLFRLFQLLIGQEKFDIALNVLERLEIALRRNPVLGMTAEDLLDPEVRERLQTHVEEVRLHVADSREQGLERPSLAMIAINGRCPALALSIIEEDLTAVAGEPGLQLLYGTLLLDNGRGQEAWEQLEGMERLLPKGDVPPQLAGFVSQWRSMNALVNLAAGETERPLQLWSEDAAAQVHSTISSLISQPFASAMIDVQHDLWPATSASLALNAVLQFPERWSQLLLEQALIQLEAGRLQPARELLEQILQGHPEFSQRGVVVFYLTMLTGNDYDITPPSHWIPVWEGMFAPDEEHDANE